MRALLATLGMLLLIAALALLVYTLTPNPLDRSIFPVAPTLLVPPGAGD
jgi:hypothetical protein